MEEKQMLYINVMICDSDSNRIIDLENKLEEIGELEHIKINIETRHELELQTIENWLPETYDILFINLDRETHQVHWKRNPTTCRLCLGGTFLSVKRLNYRQR